MKNFQLNVTSEIGKLNGVILHTPGIEVENMTPENAEKALYSDILNLSIAQKEYAQFKGALQKVTNVFEVKDLLAETLHSHDAKASLLEKICCEEKCFDIIDELKEMPTDELARQLLQGVPIQRDNLTNFLTEDRFALRPLHNFLFTRDASMSVWDNVLIGKMASKVRERESFVMETIFQYHPTIKASTVNPLTAKRKFPLDPRVSIEGGDVQVGAEDLLVIGCGSRTTTYGIDFIIETLKQRKDTPKHIIVQELPHTPESFIHLDMVFTFLAEDKCMVYEPLILGRNKYQTIHIEIDNGKVKKIETEENLLKALAKRGIHLDPVQCGGTADRWTMEREQWHSGANFFSFAPGKVIGYARNVHTIEEMNKHGFEVIPALDFIVGKRDVNDYEKAVVTIEGSELARGGGGARCMSMPIQREKFTWK
ncbi:arginine deiminase [Halosquirtibacter xylanolyticus]|uniref:arginine deiminase n=1 Tax=Halosquirtibacter xylanolyticus TaxID=3374599 RepID=UPI003749E415|nr:arginine deiminase [Prolixibacteraceae bacterium]